MRWWRRLLLLLPGRRRARARELDEELRANLALALEDAVEDAGSCGVSREEAERIARREFGSLTRAREEARAVWFPGWDTLSQDVRYALRTLAREPGFSAVAVVTLALGVGASAALFSLVNTIVLKPLSYRDSGRLVFVQEVVPPIRHVYPTLPVNIQHFRFWRERNRSFEAMAAIGGAGAMLGGAEPEHVSAAVVSADLFRVLGVEPQLGRGFLPEEEGPGRNSVVVITDTLWRARFGASRDILGRKILVNDSPMTVVGVLPPDFRFPKGGDLGTLSNLGRRIEIFLPLGKVNEGWGGDYDYIVFGRLRSGVSQTRAVSELDLLDRNIAAQHRFDYVPHVEVRQLREVIASPVRTPLVVLFSAVLLLLLIVCVNLANLLLARGSARSREYGLRVALGAGRARLVAAALVETLLLSLAGGALGLAIARAAVGIFVRTAPADLPRLDEVRVDGTVMAFAFAAALACALLFGLLPAIRLSRVDPQPLLRGGGPTLSVSGRELLARQILVAGEVGLSAMLLVFAGLLVASVWHVLHVDRGFTAGNAIVMDPWLPGSRYREMAARAEFFDRALDRIRALLGVRCAAAVNNVPLNGESNVNTVELDGADQAALDAAGRQRILVNTRFISGDYFAALGIPLLRGRAIETADRGRKVAVVSTRLAEKLWPGRNPLGKRIKDAGSGVHDVEVVGVVADVHNSRLERDPTLVIYVPFWRYAYQVSEIVVRPAADPAAVMPDLRRAIGAVDASVSVRRMRTMDGIVSSAVAQRRFQMRLASAFGVAALLLAALGIYGVVAYSVTLRRREFGIRLALGARAGEVVRMVLWRGMRPVALGLAAGMAGALAVGGLIRGMLFGITPENPLMLAAVAAGLALVAAMACLIPARSATGLEPSRVLRED